jgi:hypothetical protein
MVRQPPLSHAGRPKEFNYKLARMVNEITLMKNDE